MILLIDNYDSFTFNVEQYLAELGAKVKVVRNDQITLAGIHKLRPTGLVISPGPGNPDEAGITLSAIEEFAGVIPILGICLGHQAIGQVFGGTVKKAPRMMHGKTSVIKHDGLGLFKGLAKSIEVTRYHSLHVDEDGFPKVLKITARAADDGVVMGLRHRQLKIEGVQFHPESYRTEEGHAMLRNFLKTTKEKI